MTVTEFKTLVTNKDGSVNKNAYNAFVQLANIAGIKDQQKAIDHFADVVVNSFAEILAYAPNATYTLASRTVENCLSVLLQTSAMANYIEAKLAQA